MLKIIPSFSLSRLRLMAIVRFGIIDTIDNQGYLLPGLDNILSIFNMIPSSISTQFLVLSGPSYSE